MKIVNPRVVPDVAQKYIIAKIFNSDELLLWGDPEIEWHKDIAEEMGDAGLVVEWVRGGGRLKFVTDSKTIYVWGKSSMYGAASFREAKNILRIAYSDYDILNEIPPEE